MKRFLACCGLLPLLLAAAPALAVGEAPPGPSPERVNPAAQPGAFCPPSRCRPREASTLSTAAFGAAVVAIGWRARRREADQA